jgi:predicted flap endonuclease-1-like 5' DNA nuclease
MEMVMPAIISDNLILFGLGLLVLLVAAFLLLRPRQRVRLTDEGVPLRPHMAVPAKRGEGRGLAAEAAAAASDVAGAIIGAPVHASLPGASGPPDDLQRLKGVGPRFAELLNARGITRFDQLAKLGPDEVARLDNALGPFRGRLVRDRVIEQADYLGRGDLESFEEIFGKM